MNKRRRTPSVISRNVDEEDCDTSNTSTSTETVRKKKKLLDPVEQMQTLYDTIRNLKKEDGNLLCDAFIRVPKRRQEPGYHDVVSNPIDMLKIQQKLKTEEYEDIDELQTDFELLVNNAKSFYKRTSQEHKDANELWEVFLSTKARLFDVNDEPPTPPVTENKGKIVLKARRSAASTEVKKESLEIEESSTDSWTTGADDELCEDLFSAVINAADADGRLLYPAFQLLPSKKLYPKYYEVIDNPIDLRSIARKIQDAKYSNLNELEKDLLLMAKNACTFNEPGSQIYKDAKALKKIVTTKKIEIEHGKSTIEKKSERIRNKRLRNSSQALSAITAAVKSDDEESEKDVSATDDGEDQEEEPHLPAVEEEDPDNPRWKLFNAVRNFTNAYGVCLADQFEKLPSKRYFPNWYKEIKNRLSLSGIRKKLLAGFYGTVSEVAGDLNIVFENAKTFNKNDNPKVFKDAVKLQKFMQTKFQEILDYRHQPPRAASKQPPIIEDDVEEESPPPSVLPPASPTPAAAPVEETPPIKDSRVRDRYQCGECSKRVNSNDRLSCSICHLGYHYQCMGMKEDNFRKMNRMYRANWECFACRLQIKSYQYYLKEYSESEDDDGFAFLGSASTSGGGDEPALKRAKSARIKLTRGKYLHNIPLKRRLHKLCKCVMDYMTEDGRQPMLMFMEKPSKKLYPDYYEVISEPIDMLTIENKIRNEIYQSEEEVLNDFKLMFRNCREYNEEGSLIYEDANTLEKLVFDRAKELGPMDRPIPRKSMNNIGLVVHPRIITKKQPLPPTPTMMKMRTLFQTIKDYKDPKGRLLSVIFHKLPSKIEYPDYYEVIKRPINIEIISQKLKGNCYESLDDLVSDFVLMFDNACKYNEPDSQIYKDALVLQRVTLQTKMQLREDEDTVPDVPSAVQELLTSLFTSVYNHQDEEGRCFSDSLAELPEHDEQDGKRIRGISLDLIKRRLDSGQYRRLDMFQDDVFSCLERARRLSRTDSQVFEDSIELQSFFIRQRDEICRNGDLLNSPALNYSQLDLSISVNELRELKSKDEQPEQKEEDPDSSSIKDEMDSILVDDLEDGQIPEAAVVAGGPKAMAVDNAMSFNQQVYRIGDFVYTEPKERGMQPMIYNIQRLWTNVDQQQMLFGNQYYRPDETYHVTTRRFLEKEVFKTDQHMAIPLSNIRGRCAVLSVKDYFRAKPEGFDDKDVYVCESRYSSKTKTFKKIKSWPLSLTNVCKLIDRETPLEPVRTFSVYRERIEKHKEEIAELEEQEKLLEKDKPNVITTHLPANAEEDCTYYEQYNAPHLLIRIGDCVYIRNDSKNTSRTLICQINKIWTNKNGEALIHGPWLVLPADVPHPPNRLFYKQEILLSILENTNEVSQIVGKCAVLEHSEYISCRPTEVPESEVYICESMFDEARQQIVELPKDGLKKFVLSSAAYQDEIYFFRRLINPMKVNSFGEPAMESRLNPADRLQSMIVQNEANFQNCSATMIKIEPADANTEDSMDGGPPSVCSSDLGAPSTPNSICNYLNSSQPGKKKRGPDPSKLKQVTGYLLYAREMRKSILQANPNRTFGEVSRIVGTEWKKLTMTERNLWEEKAQRINEETQMKVERGEIILSSSMQASFIGPNLPDHVWECHWDNCDFMFEDQIDCLEHAVTDNGGHVATSFAGIHPTEAEYQCQWRACPRIKKSSPPFPSLHRLLRHVKEVHILKSTGRVVPPNERSKNYIPCIRNPPPPTPPPATTSPPVSSPAISTVAASISLTDTKHVGGMHGAVGTGVNLQSNRNTPSPKVQGMLHQGMNINNNANNNGSNNNNSNQNSNNNNNNNNNNHNDGTGCAGVSSANRRTTEPLFVVVPPKPHRVMHSDIYVKYIENLSSDRPAQVSNWEKQLYACAETTRLPFNSSKLPSHWLASGAGNHGSVVNALWALRNYMLKDALSLHNSA